MNDYLYLFRGGDNPHHSPDEMQEHLKKWNEWLKKLADDGKFKAGEPLAEGGKTVSGTDRIVTDGPFAESKEVVGGYLVVQVADEDEAVELAKGCPIYESGGAVEVRRITPIDMPF